MESISKKEWILWAILTGILVIATLFVGRASVYLNDTYMTFFVQDFKKFGKAGLLFLCLRRPFLSCKDML